MGPPFAAPSTRDLIVCRGNDASSFLAGQLSADIAALGVGDATHTFVLDPDGKVSAWGQLVRTGEQEFTVVLVEGAGPTAVERLNRFRIRVDIDIELEAGVVAAECRGAGAPELAATLGGQPIDLGWPDGSEAVDVLRPTADLPTPADPTAVHRVRIEAGVPELGADLVVGDIPAEGGRWVIDASVSFTKGCFVGQELVARVDSRGARVPRRNCLVELSGEVEPGATVTLDGADVGHVTSSAGELAMARLARRVEAGMAVAVGTASGSVTRDLGS